jgi:lysozyme
MEALIDSIKRHEGLRLFPYQDTTYHTSIGYGRNLDERGITNEEAEFMLKTDIAMAEKRFGDLPDAVQDNCNDARRDVLIEMIFQMGYIGVLRFKRMLGAIAAGDFERASKEMFMSRWASQAPSRCKEMAEVMRRG